MKKELIINVTPKEVVIALLEDKRLVELHKEKHNSEYAVGDLYLGRVRKLVPGLNAAFVDVGYEKDAFLHYFDLGPQVQNLLKYTGQVRSKSRQSSSLSKDKVFPDINKEGNIKEVLKPGQELLVQVAKEPISTKGPRISTELSIAGRYLVMVPFTDRISVSSKIKSRKEKDRLKRLIQSIKPKNFGVIVRTVAENKRVAELDRDLRELTQKWEECFNSLGDATPPSRVLGELDRTAAMLRDVLNDEFNSIIINDQKLYDETLNYLKSIAPDKAKIVKLHKGSRNLFDHYGIEKQIKASFGRHVSMQSGVYLVIEHTEALHVIDVNSGNTSKKEKSQEENALRTNLEAAEEIARQLRLRDMGGIIVVDFIDMQNNENRKKLFNKMTEVMEEDRAKHYILPPSRFGLIEITRQRVRPEMEIKTAEYIPSETGEPQKVQATILLIDEIEQNLISAMENKGEKVASLKAHPFVHAYFVQNKRKYQYKWLMKYKRWISIIPRTAYPLMQYKLLNTSNEEIIFEKS